MSFASKIENTNASPCSSTKSSTDAEFPKKLFLGVSSCTTEHQLYLLAVPFGPIRSIHIPKDKETQNSRGFAFVTFQRHEHAVAAMEDWENRPLEGLILHPRWATAKTSQPKRETRKRETDS